MQNFRNLGASGGGGDQILMKPPMAHPWLISCVLSHYVCSSIHAFFR